MTGVRLRALVAVVVAMLFTVLFAGPAAAHANLLSATPSDTSVVQEAPTQITLTYDEGVGTQTGAVKVLAPDGTRVDTGEVALSDGGRTVTAALQPNLARGTYTILWRVLSEDSHSIFGASSFSVGAPSATVAGAAAAAEASGGLAAEYALGVGRFLLYVGLTLLVGGLAFLMVLWPAGRSVRTVRRMLWAGWGLITVATVAAVLLQGPYTAGAPLGSVFDPSLIASVLGTRYGIASVLRLVLLAGIALLLVRLDALRHPVVATVTGIVVFAMLLTVSALGHSGAGDLVPLAMVADSLHLVAMAGWLGGLAMLGLIVLRRNAFAGVAAGASPDPRTLLPRWSRFATVAVAVLVVTGTFTAWRQVRHLDALISTTYGWTLLIKLALVAVVLLLAAVARRWVTRNLRRSPAVVTSPVAAPSVLVYADGSTAVEPTDLDPGRDIATGDTDLDRPGTSTGARPAPALGRLRRGVLIEALLAVVVLGVTSVLVATTPSRDTYFPVFEQSVAATADLQVDITVDPARAGLNGLEFTFTRGGTAVDVVKVTTRWTSQDGSFVIPAELTRSATGVYRATGLLLPSVGEWKLALTTQTSDIDSRTVVLTVPIR